MGAFCCCPWGEDFGEYAHPSSSIYRDCICLRYYFHQLFSGYIFQRLEGRAVTSPAQGVPPLTSTGLSNPSADSSFSETHHLLPRPAPYDTDPGYSGLQRGGLVSRREKFMSHIQEASQLHTRSSSSSCVEHLGSGKKKNSADSVEECKSCRSESEKIMSAKGLYGTGYVLTTSEDEDVCPTCLDEYTPENPKIITKCSHHFHLGCIYEWMERSEFCPLCGKTHHMPECFVGTAASNFGDGVLRKPMIKIEVFPVWCLKFKGDAREESANKLLESQRRMRFKLRENYSFLEYTYKT